MNYNAHAGSYTWKVRNFMSTCAFVLLQYIHKIQALFDGDFVPLNMDKTLEQNSIPDDYDYYYPPIYLYFNDDLTEA